MARRKKNKVCKIRSENGRYYLDFGRRAEPRKLYSFRGTPFTSKQMARGIVAYIEMERAKERPLGDILSELRPGGGEAAIMPLMERWLGIMRREAEAGILSPNSVRELERWAKPGGHFSYWSGMSVHEIDAATLREWNLWLAERPKMRRGKIVEPVTPISAGTARNVVAGFHTFCVWVSKIRPSFQVPKHWTWPEPVEHVPTVLSIEIQGKVLAEIAEPDRGLFIAMAHLGIRPSEARVLRVRDWTGDELRVARARKGHRLDSPVRGPKKARGVKVLPVTPELRAWLDRYVPPERRLEDPDGPLFVSSRSRRLRGAEKPSGWWSEGASQTVWREACDAAGVPRVRMYEGTKHSLATALKTAGVDDRVIARMLGHSDPRSVERYGKIQTSTVASALARLRPRNDAPGAE